MNKESKIKGSKKECGRCFREIRRLAAQFAERVDFSPRTVKAIKKMEFASGDDFVCACAVLSNDTDAGYRITRAQILSALVYAEALNSKRVGLSFDDLETIFMTARNEVVFNFTFGFKIAEGK